MDTKLMLGRDDPILQRLKEKFDLSDDQIITAEEIEASGQECKVFDGPEAVKRHNELRELCEKEFGPQEYQ